MPNLVIKIISQIILFLGIVLEIILIIFVLIGRATSHTAFATDAFVIVYQNFVCPILKPFQ